MSTFSLQGSFRMTSGAIQDTVPANDIFVLFSFHSRLVPKSEIFTTSFLATRTLEITNETHILYFFILPTAAIQISIKEKLR